MRLHNCRIGKIKLFLVVLFLFIMSFLLRKNNGIGSSTHTQQNTRSTESYGINSSKCENDMLQQRLFEANENWNKHKSRLNGRKGLMFEWDALYPSFDCPYTKERIGWIGDGGKWICGMDKLEKLDKCLVYSFGISRETSFEQEFAQRTNCTIRMFDHTIRKTPKLVRSYCCDRVTFEKYGLKNKAENPNDPDQHVKSIKALMDIYNDSFIDVLKIDTEGAEWNGTRETIQDFTEGLPFAQLSVELHLHLFKENEKLKELHQWWDMVVRAGLRAFSSEPNMHVPHEANEYSFINIITGPFTFKANSSSISG